MPTKCATADEWSQRFLQSHPICDSLVLDVAGLPIAVHANSCELLAALRAYFGEFVAGADVTPTFDVHVLETPAVDVDVEFKAYPISPGKTRLKDAYADFPDGRMLRKVRTGMLFVFGTAGGIAIGPCLANLNQTINFINNRYTQWRLDRGALLCHAGCVAANGRALAIAAASSRGKSTLALRLLSAGLDFVSNDRLLIERGDDGVIVYGLPKHPRVNPGTLLTNPELAPLLSPTNRQRLEAMPLQDLWRLEEKSDVDISACYGPGRFHLRADLHAFALLNWNLTDEPARISDVDLAQRPDLVHILSKDPAVHYVAPADAPPRDFSSQAYVRLLADCQAFEFTGGVDFVSAVHACLERLER